MFNATFYSFTILQDHKLKANYNRRKTFNDPNIKDIAQLLLPTQIKMYNKTYDQTSELKLILVVHETKHKDINIEKVLVVHGSG